MEQDRKILQIDGLSRDQAQLSLGILLWVPEEGLCKGTFYYLQKNSNEVKLVRQPYTEPIKDIWNIKSKETLLGISCLGCQDRDEDNRRTWQTKSWQKGLKCKKQCQAYRTSQWAKEKDKQPQRAGDWVNDEKQEEESRWF